MAEEEKEIGRQIRALRQRRRWSQEELAAKLSISRPQLSNYENGKNAIPAKVAAEIAFALQRELQVDGCTLVPGRTAKNEITDQLCLDFDKDHKFGPFTVRPSRETVTFTTSVIVSRRRG